MELHTVSIAKPSARVLGKMKRGETVRVTKGMGMNLIVNPATYNDITKTFNKGKGLHIALSPEEIHHNRGRGVFDKIKSVASKVGSVAKPMAKAGLKIAKPFIKDAAHNAIATGSAALIASNPELAPLAPIGVAGLNSAADSAINRIAGQGLFAEPMGGQGLYAEPLASMRARGFRHTASRREMGSIGVHGNLLRGGALPLPPALMSQPYSANFQFQHTLPPAYQSFTRKGTY